MKDKGPLLILILAVLFGAIFVGGILEPTEGDPNGSEMPIQSQTIYACCDTGSGAACQPQRGPGQILTYRGEEYGLLRTNTQFIEGNLHLRDTGELFSGNPIIENSSDTHIIPDQFATADCRTEAKDKYIREIPPPNIIIGTPESVPYCTSVDDDILIFVCKEQCAPSSCPPVYGPDVTCYGSSNSVYDVYVRLRDASNIPDFVRNCSTNNLTPIPTDPNITGTQQVIIPGGASPRDTLQLRTFTVQEQVQKIMVPWLSPFCKR